MTVEELKKRLDAIERLTDYSKMKLDEKGELKEPDELKKAIDKEWGDYKVTVQKRGAEVATPPKGTDGGSMSRAAELAAKYRADKYGVRSEKE